MDDIHLEDPRKFSAKQIKVTVEKAKKHRTFWQYMFDLIVKTEPSEYVAVTIPSWPINVLAVTLDGFPNE